MADALIAHLHDLFALLGPVTTRAMFGGHGLYLDGLIIGVVIDEALYLKADEETRARFESAGGSPFTYAFKQGRRAPVTMGYWSVPDEAMESPQAMLSWARLARNAALRKPKTRRPRLGRRPGGWTIARRPENRRRGTVATAARFNSCRTRHDHSAPSLRSKAIAASGLRSLAAAMK